MDIKITLDNRGDHPLYNFQLLAKDGKYRIEQSLRFAACRDFHTQVIIPSKVQLEAVFPETKKRSSLGIKLSDDMLVSRTTSLNTYISEVLDRFNEFPTSVQDAFVELLSAQSVPLAYFRDEVPKSVSPELPSSSGKPSLSVSHPSDLDEIILIKNKKLMEIKMTLNNTGEHPLYKMQLYSKDEVYKVEQSMRFAAYRDFHESVMSNCIVQMSNDFPPTLARSALGIKLSDEELNTRTTMLHKYMNEVLVRFNELSPDTKLALIAFLKADYIPVVYFNNNDTSRTSESASVKSKDRQSLSQKIIHQMSHLSGRASSAEDVSQKQRPPLSVQVSRNMSEGHVRFDVIVRVFSSDDRQITVCSRPFKDFRRLRNEIAGNIEELEQQNVISIPHFPRTYARSSLGFKLSELEIVTRVRNLDQWTRAIVKSYHILSNRSQLLLNHFLNLDCLVNNEKYEEIILSQLKNGNICGEGDAPRPTIPELAHDLVGESDDFIRKSSDDNPIVGMDTPEGEWMVIGKNKEDAPPRGCCVIS